MTFSNRLKRLFRAEALSTLQPAQKRQSRSRGRTGNAADPAEIRELVKSAQISVGRFAHAVGIAERTLYCYMSGERPAPLHIIGSLKWTLMIMGAHVTANESEIQRVHKARQS